MPSIETLRRLVGPCVRLVWPRSRGFRGSQRYWIERYRAGGDSGDGSYNLLAEFKAEILNAFVRERGVSTVIEFGSGDGNQLRLAEYPRYLGFDVSPDAVARCRQLFASDRTKTFGLLNAYRGERAELVLSLDVIYHLVEDEVYDAYMRTLFDAAERFVVVYSTNADRAAARESPHVRHRRFTDWVDANRPDWRLLRQVPNRYPFKGDYREGSDADFYLYERRETHPRH